MESYGGDGGGLDGTMCDREVRSDAARVCGREGGRSEGHDG